MTKRFKHIPTGNIFCNDEDGDYFYEENSMIHRSVPNYIVNGKDWEEVKEKTYRITKIKNLVNDIIVFTTSSAYFETGTLKGRDALNANPERLVELGCTIEQVERLSDKQIFSIGDKTEERIISKFSISENSIVVYFEAMPVWTFLQNVKKIETPILITEDGVKCYSENHPELFWVDLVNWETGTDSRNKFRSTQEIFTLNIKYFASKENRDEWVLKNKKLFSLDDLYRYLDLSSGLLEKFRNLAKSKV